MALKSGSVSFHGSFSEIPSSPQVKYTIQTITGAMPGAGTSASVFLQLHGSLADGPRARYALDPSTGEYLPIG